MAHRFAEALAPLGLRPPHFGVMTLIEAHPGLAQRDLVTRSLIDPSSMVAVIDELEQMGLAERRRDTKDRRKHAVHLTARGRRTLESAREVAEEMVQKVLAPLDSAELETLRRLLRKLAGAESESQ
jgi:DNA-binding MarR family transcriptional regulator